MSIENKNETIVPKKKSRNLSTLEFLEVLQIEWIVADLRAKIYPKINDKNFWKNVRAGKEATIKKISENNKLPNIFTDSDLLRTIEERVYRDKPYPEFVYRDEAHKLEQGYWDLCYYYHKGSDVRFDYYGEIKTGKIVEYKPYGSTLIVHSDELKEDIVFPLKEVTRIL